MSEARWKISHKKLQAGGWAIGKSQLIQVMQQSSLGVRSNICSYTLVFKIIHINNLFFINLSIK